MDLKSMDDALKKLYEPRPPRFDEDGDNLVMRCETCSKEVIIPKGGKFPCDWRIVKWHDVETEESRLDPYCLPCFEIAKVLRDGMVSVGLLPE